MLCLAYKAGKLVPAPLGKNLKLKWISLFTTILGVHVTIQGISRDFKQISLSSIKRGKIFISTSVTSKLSCNINDSEWIQSPHMILVFKVIATIKSSWLFVAQVRDLDGSWVCFAIYIIYYEFQVRDLDGSCVEKFVLPKKKSQCTEPIIDNGNAFMTSSRIVEVCI